MMNKNISRAVFIPVLLVLSFLLCSCSKDDSVTPDGGNTFDGAWTVDNVQLVSAPSGSGVSAMMKQALVSFGSVSGNFVGNMDVNFNVETAAKVSSNLAPGTAGRISFKSGVGFMTSSGFLYKSLDGGVTWNQLTAPSFNTEDFYEFDQNKIFILYRQSGKMRLGKSNDQGFTWDTLSTDLSTTFYYGNTLTGSIYFTSDQTGYIMSGAGIYKTNNGGVNWVSVQSVSTSSPAGIKFFDSNRGMAVYLNAGLANLISYSTSDGGATWVPGIYGSVFAIYDMDFADANTCFVIANDPAWDGRILLKSTDGGFSWGLANNDANLTRIGFINGTTGYGASNDVLLKTEIGGLGWTPIGSEDLGDVNAIKNINGTAAFFTNKGLLKSDGGLSSSQWTASGWITNTAVKLITKAKDYKSFVNGEYSVSNSTIVFTINNYSSGGENNRIGVGSFSFENGFLSITLELANNEKWMIKLRRR